MPRVNPAIDTEGLRRISDALKVRIPGPSAVPDPDFARDLADIIRNHPEDEFSPWDNASTDTVD